MFAPQHIDATAGDFEGNGGRGRHLLLPGSPGRAAAIAERFEGATVKPHPRGHDLHLGSLRGEDGRVDVGCIATGMGGPSVEIILSELLELGARSLLRVGTAGSLQPWVGVGDVVIATAAVRDEAAGDDYLPREIPAMASLSMVDRLRAASSRLSMDSRTHCGVVHSKSTLYAREFGRGPLGAEHDAHKQLLRAGGVLASEMECATTFVMAMEADRRARIADPEGGVEVGAALAIIGGADEGFAEGTWCQRRSTRRSTWRCRRFRGDGARCVTGGAAGAALLQLDEAVGGAAVARHLVAVVTLLVVAGLNDPVAAGGSHGLAAGGAGSGFTAEVEPVVAELPFGVLHHSVAAVGRKGAVGIAGAVAPVVDAVVARLDVADDSVPALGDTH